MRSYLQLAQRYTARLSGALLGLLVAELAGGALGLLIGWIVDDWRYYAPVRPGRWRRWSDEAGERVFLSALFAWAGHIAKLDGRVSEQEIQATRTVMAELGLDEASRQLAIEQFGAGKQPTCPRRRLLWRLRRHRGGDRHRRWLRLLLRVVMADGVPGAVVEARMRQAARVLGLSGEAFRELWQSALEARKRRQRVNARTSRWAQEVLGVAAEAGHAEVRLAYRRVVSRHHPDRLLARGVEGEALRSAAARTREARAAYEALCQERGWRR
ncbi:TerB family tellurite resistance protein [Arhodomonas sp. AD133]|uniref:TerB family tellurite resistance protein n=1 Tax=Arhodomonas sp. AD133 TaxID=3415009 RepID=UPI003EBC3BE9